MSAWLAKKVATGGSQSVVKSIGLEEDKPQKLSSSEVQQLEAQRKRERDRKRSKNRAKHDAMRKKHGLKTSAELEQENRGKRKDVGKGKEIGRPRGRSSSDPKSKEREDLKKKSIFSSLFSKK